MANFKNYPIKDFSTDQKFLADDPNQVVRVTGQSMLDATVENLKKSGDVVNSIDTLTEAIAGDYLSGIYLLVGGGVVTLDGDQAIYRVSDAGSGGIVMANGNELVLLFVANTPANIITPIDSVANIAGYTGTADDQQISLKGWHPDSDVGGGTLYWDSAALKSTHNGGTIFSPTVPWTTTTADYLNAVGETDGAGAGVWVLIFDLTVDAANFGSGTSDDTDSFLALITAQQTQQFIATYNQTLNLNNIALTGIRDLVFKAGPDGILDFALVSSGIGLYIGFDVPLGGSQRVTWDGLQITDSRTTSLCDELFQFESGPTGQSPAQTSGFLTVNGGQVLKYNNLLGVARHLKNVSHVTFNDWQDAFQLGCLTALKFGNTISINTGVFNFNNCIFRSSVTPLHAYADGTLVDTINFNGGFFGNDDTGDASDCMLIAGSFPVANLNFYGPHMESRDELEEACIRVTGKLKAFSFNGHWSCGEGAKFTKYFLYFDEGSECIGGTLQGEFLRLKNQADGGALVHFENDVVTDSSQPLVIPTYFPNSSTPITIDVETGVNEQEIYKSCIAPPFTSTRFAVGKDRIYPLEDSATPTVKGGISFEINAVPANTTITDFVDEYRGQVIKIVNNAGGSVTIQNGATTIKLNGGVDFVMTAGDSLELLRTGLTTNHWIETGRAVT